MLAEVTARAPIQIYQGTVALRELARVALEMGMGAKAESGLAAKDMLPPKVHVEMISPKKLISRGKREIVVQVPHVMINDIKVSTQTFLGEYKPQNASIRLA
jgi:hypothetical protein